MLSSNPRSVAPEEGDKMEHNAMSAPLKGEEDLGVDLKFDVVTYNVTDTGCQTCCCIMCPILYLPLVPGVMGTKVLTLEEEEAVLTVDCFLCTSRSRRPYGELGSVDSVRYCWCWGVNSNLLLIGGNPWPIIQGWGCDRETAEEIATIMRTRMKQRGDTGQIRMAERNYRELQAVRRELGELRESMARLTAI
mmetsp:Transcript_18818/g.57178  ORF Transcript_18818/g.57178 Transcript_18818/m.57178 type:complete len:192 (-) Transcript_18818:38-613(-)